MHFLNTRLISLFCVFPLLIIVFDGCYYSRKSARILLEKSRSEGYDLIIVPGVPFENGKWSKTMKGRIYWSKYLFDQGIAKNILYSGSAVYSPYYEGSIMALYAEALGIPGQHVLAETKAEHSTENLYYSFRMAKALGFKRIALASDPFQVRTLRSFSRRKVNPDIGLIPMVMDTMLRLQTTMIDPEIDYQKAFKKDFVSIKKRQGFWKRFRGTMGKNIDSLNRKSTDQ